MNPDPGPKFEHVRNIVLVRHGQTPANAADRTGRFFDTAADIALLDGKPDHELPLTDKGREQARRIGRRIRTEWRIDRFDYYYDSGYRRAMDTLDLALEAFPASERDENKRRSHLDLRERDTGYPYVLTVQEGRTLFPWWERYEQLVGPVYARPPGGESIADAWQRVHMFLNSVRRARAGKDILVVTHGRLMVGFKYWLEKTPARDINRLFAEHKDIENGEAWWYHREPADRSFTLRGRLVPGD